MSQLETNGHPHNEPLTESGQDLTASGGNPGDPQQIALSRRNLLKVLVAGGSATAIHLALPAEWVRPVVEIGVLPVHAAISNPQPVAVEDGPTGVVVIGNEAYITNQNANTLSIATLAEDTSKTKIRAFSPYPDTAVTASMGGKLYMAEGQRLSVFSEAHGGWVGTVPLSHPATAIAAAQGRVYAVGGDSLWVIDAAADIILTTLSGFTSPTAMSINEDRLLVTDSGKQFEIDLLTDQLVGSTPLGLNQGQDNQSPTVPAVETVIATMKPFSGPGDMVYADGQIFIVNETGNFLSILSLDEGKVRNVPVGKTPKAVAVADGVAYVTNFGDNTLSVVTLGGLVPQVTTVSGVGVGPWGVGLIGSDIYVASHTDSKLWRVSKSGTGYAAPTEVPSLTALSKPRHLDTAGQKIYVTSSDTAKLLIVDTTTPVTSTSFDVLTDAYDVKISASKIYVTSGTDKNLSILDLDGTNKTDFPVGAGPRGVDYAPTISQAIVANFDDDKIQQITP